MNPSYQHKKGPPKLIKDLKHGQTAHLRQSLLDISEIQNLNKIFDGRKNHYRIEGIKSDSPNKKKQVSTIQNEEQINEHQLYTLSPEENLQLIKRQRIANKMKDKLQLMFKSHQERKYKLRKPVLHNLLEDFKSSFRIEEQIKFKQALKDSEKNVQHIKINSKKRISSQYVRGDIKCERKKFLSISTGMPVKKNSWLPTFQEFVNGKFKSKENKFVGIDIVKIDNYFSTLITEPSTNIELRSKKSSFKDEFLKNFNRQTNSINSTNLSKNNSPLAKHCTQGHTAQLQSVNSLDTDKEIIKLLITNKGSRSKSAINPDFNFKRSQESSKKVINVMQSYYDTKRQKIKQCDSMIEYIKKDRPLTSLLRRKNYNIIGNSHIDHVEKYRQKTQEERQKILQKNYNFYISLLKTFEHCKKQEISSTIKILNRLKDYFESEYVLLRQDIQKICTLEKNDKKDFGVDIIRDNLLDYSKKEQNLTTENSEPYELL